MPKLSSLASLLSTLKSRAKKLTQKVAHQARRTQHKAITFIRDTSRRDRRHLVFALIGSLTITIALLALASTITPQPAMPEGTLAEPTTNPPSPGNLSLGISAPIDSSFVDLQPTVDAWLARNRNISAGILIYDLDCQQVAAEYHADERFNVASIYKLFYVYASYREASKGNLELDDYFVTTKDYRAGRYTVGQCLDLMIRESYNGCADPMHDHPAYRARVSSLISELQLKNTASYGLESSPRDLTKLLIKIYEHSDISDKLWTKFADSLLSQPRTKIDDETTYDWRQGLPSGFSSAAKVYNKVGWDWTGEKWDTFADAAIVEFPDLNRHYTIVVVTSGLKDPATKPIRNLATSLEQAITSAN